jgi:predicted signal transduction protein with EAL and GGDEF domain
LTNVAAHLRAYVRSTDIVGRIGGDEFAVLMPDTGAACAASLALRIIGSQGTAGTPAATVSIGVAGLTASEPTAKRLFRDADTAMYAAKAKGRNTMAISAPSTLPHVGVEAMPAVEPDVAADSAAMRGAPTNLFRVGGFVPIRE